MKFVTRFGAVGGSWGFDGGYTWRSRIFVGPRGHFALRLGPLHVWGHAWR